MSLVEAVSCGTLTGSALAITGSPQSRATPAATTAHRRTIRIVTKSSQVGYWWDKTVT